MPRRFKDRDLQRIYEFALKYRPDHGGAIHRVKWLAGYRYTLAGDIKLLRLSRPLRTSQAYAFWAAGCDVARAELKART
jgi:hypothetical protein